MAYYNSDRVCLFPTPAAGPHSPGRDGQIVRHALVRRAGTGRPRCGLAVSPPLPRLTTEEDKVIVGDEDTTWPGSQPTISPSIL